MGLEAGSQLKSQGKWLGVGGTFLWDFTYLCWNLTFISFKPLRSATAYLLASQRDVTAVYAAGKVVRSPHSEVCLSTSD